MPAEFSPEGIIPEYLGLRFAPAILDPFLAQDRHKDRMLSTSLPMADESGTRVYLEDK